MLWNIGKPYRKLFRKFEITSGKLENIITFEVILEKKMSNILEKLFKRVAQMLEKKCKKNFRKMWWKFYSR